MAVFLPVLLLLLTVTSIVRAITISILWKWFIVTTFGLAPLAPMHALGLSLFLSYLLQSTKTSSHKNKGWNEIVDQLVIASLVEPVIVLVIGYVVKSFM